MSVYNAESYLDESIQSVLKQSYSNFEFIIIDDGCTDGSLQIIEKYSRQDTRILIISRENKGLIYSLNEGLSLAKGKFIARMDADDISHINRFEKQVNFLNSNPEVGVISCDVQCFDGNSYENWPFYTEKHEDIIAFIPFHSPIVHAAVMIKRHLLNETSYDSDYSHAEDYKLWIDLCQQTKFYSLPSVLYYIRHHEEKVSVKQNKEQVTNSLRVIKEYLSSIGVDVWNQNLHRSIITTFFRENQINIYSLFDYLDQLKSRVNNPCFSQRTDWIKAIFAVHNAQIPFSFIFHLIFFHFRSLRYISIKQFLSLTKRSFLK